MTGHTGVVTSVAFSPEGNRIASSSLDRSAKLWDLGTGTEISTLRIQTSNDSKATSSSFNPRETPPPTPLSADDTRAQTPPSIPPVSAKLTDPAVVLPSSNQSLPRSPRPTPPPIPVIRPQASRPGSTQLSIDDDATVNAWEMPPSQPLLSDVLNPSDPVPSTPANLPAFAALGQSPVATPEAVMTEKPLPHQDLPEIKAPEILEAEVYLPALPSISAGSNEITIAVPEIVNSEAVAIEVEAPKLHVDFPVISVPEDKLPHLHVPPVEMPAAPEPTPPVIAAHGPVESVPTGTAIALHDQRRSDAIFEVKPRIAQLDSKGGAFNALAFSPDGHLLAAARGDATVLIWETATGVVQQALHGHNGEVHHLAFAPDGRRLCTAGADMTARIWDVGTGNELFVLARHLSQVTAAIFSPDGRWLATSSWDKNIKIWDVSNGEDLVTLVGHTDGVATVAFAPSGMVLASGGEDGTVRLWNLENGQEILQMRGHSREVCSVAFSPDGQSLASGGGDGTVKIWDAATGEEWYSFQGHDRLASAVTFAPKAPCLPQRDGIK